QTMADEPVVAEASADEPQENVQAEGLELNPSIELSSQGNDDKTLVLESAHSILSDESSQQKEGLSDDETAEQSAAVNEGDGQEDAGEATIMAAPGDNPALRSVIKYDGNIEDLIEKQIPQDIPDERIKPLVFLYTIGDEGLCADILNTMDTICLKSETKPMFIKRPVVKVCEPHMRGDSAQTLVSENEAMGIICVGDMPSEMIYDIENVFSTNKSYFQHINKESFNHELIVDLVADLILI
ncbi:MAG: hypothetical protein KAI33_01320, partial [Elusimicrobiales bacterium]|nr:hypothetical protein [Elusimicrobiales bacterium]